MCFGIVIFYRRVNPVGPAVSPADLPHVRFWLKADIQLTAQAADL